MTEKKPRIKIVVVKAYRPECTRCGHSPNKYGARKSAYLKPKEAELYKDSTCSCVIGHWPNYPTSCCLDIKGRKITRDNVPGQIHQGCGYDKKTGRHKD